MHPGSPLRVDKVGFQWPSRLLDISSGIWSIKTLLLCISLEEDQSPLVGKSTYRDFSHLQPSQTHLIPKCLLKSLMIFPASYPWPEIPTDDPNCTQSLQIPSDFALQNPSFCHCKIWFYLYFFKANVSCSFQFFIGRATVWVCHGWSTCMTIIGFPVTPQLPSHQTLQ